ncbi:histidine phosphatase family protein [Enterococcus pallens]|uniref:phosphoglycerate mutase (2,3-diphosphoglycerate-dependent) n=1 Tax=Enterococcus pallens ATCC BAA-351 TaxID=1158607 RepID=R2SI44_9ENTE|nr:histidine phosphatase family protein [Enterococcus pallens]EOH87869.1 phosphoglycerate mutase [Enterococcus pallens ATCC BAA-351]EOU18083.1 phosphoglycerate mutase [Enterococcus pallens ATCC BAA-351]OJG82294.1 phosphoglycerate mutase [Enterococcus pallens]
MKLYFTRHGKTQWNQEKKFQGMMGDSPLLAESFQAIETLGETLKDIPFEKIYSSSSRRAYLTAEGIKNRLSHPVEIIQSDDLRELGLGALEGQSIAKMYEKYGENMNHLRHRLDIYDPTPFGGEAINKMLSRTTGLVREAVAKAEEGPLLFVGHGASLTAAIQSLAGKPKAELRSMGGLYNNSLTILETTENDQPYRLLEWNNVDFLEQINQQPDAIL